MNASPLNTGPFTSDVQALAAAAALAGDLDVDLPTARLTALHLALALGDARPTDYEHTVLQHVVRRLDDASVTVLAALIARTARSASEIDRHEREAGPADRAPDTADRLADAVASRPRAGHRGTIRHQQP